MVENLGWSLPILDWTDEKLHTAQTSRDGKTESMLTVAGKGFWITWRTERTASFNCDFVFPGVSIL